jgi:hypothetical protein
MRSLNPPSKRRSHCAVPPSTEPSEMSTPMRSLTPPSNRRSRKVGAWSIYSTSRSTSRSVSAEPGVAHTPSEEGCNCCSSRTCEFICSPTYFPSLSSNWRSYEVVARAPSASRSLSVEAEVAIPQRTCDCNDECCGICSMESAPDWPARRALQEYYSHLQY